MTRAVRPLTLVLAIAAALLAATMLLPPAKAQNAPAVRRAATTSPADSGAEVTTAAAPGATTAPAQPVKPIRLPVPTTLRGLRAGIVRYSDIEYAKVGSKRLLLDLYLPSRAPAAMPLVVWIHGGGWLEGSKDGCPAVFLAKQGYAVASINYRLSQEAVFPAQIHDCKAAVRFLRAHAAQMKIDPQRIGVWGASAGGHLAALTGTTNGEARLEGEVGGNLQVSSSVQAVCDWFGPTKFIDGSRLPDGVYKIVEQLFGGTYSEKKDLYELGSPLNHVSKDDPPFLIMHGDRDTMVAPLQSRVFHRALADAKVDSKLMIVAGAGHGFDKREHFEAVQEFFDAKLKNAPVAQSQPATQDAKP